MQSWGGLEGKGGVPRGLPFWPHCETLNGAKAALQTEIQFGGATPLTRLEDFQKPSKAPVCLASTRKRARQP